LRMIWSRTSGVDCVKPTPDPRHSVGLLEGNKAIHSKSKSQDSEGSGNTRPLCQ
jgi:hypothetical protein